jgi:hypothetical protein
VKSARHYDPTARLADAEQEAAAASEQENDMRAEAEKLADAIRESLTLLRRHL